MSGGVMTPPDVLEALAARLPDRVRGPSEGRDGWYANACGQGMNWARLPFTSGLQKDGHKVPTFEALGMLHETLVQELEARNWAWHTHHTGPREYRSHCAQIYPSESALSGMFQAYADTPAEALARALLAALEAQS